MRLDFLMCVHEYSPFLDDAINSMLDQDYDEEYSIYIIANNCNDALWNYLRRKNDGNDKIVLFRTNVGQLAFNLNFGINLMGCDYLVRMDSDDICLRHRLTVTRSEICRLGEPDVLGGSAYIINESGEVTGKDIKSITRSQIRRRICFRNPLIHPATAIKRSSVMRVRGYLGGVHCEDYDLWSRMIRMDMSLVRISEPLIKYRLSSFQTKGSKIAYADGVGIAVREFLMSFSALKCLGIFYLLTKFLVFKFLRRMK